MPTARTPEPLVRPYRFKPEQRSYARDIDTYVRPQSKQIGAPTGPTRAERLAASLRATSPILQEYFEKQEAKRKAALIAEGERLQKESGKRDWNEWVREHPEHEKYSPWVREGFEKQAAIAYGADYQTYMQELAATDENLAAMTDPAQIDEYLSAKTAEYMRDKLGHLNDRAVQQQFMGFVNQTQTAIASQFMDKRLTEQLNEKYQAYQTGVVNLADAFTVGNMETLITADDATVEAMAAQLAAQLSMHAQNTILDVSNPKRVNDATIEAAFTWYNGVAPEYEEFAQKVIENLTGRDGAKLLGIVRYQEGWEKVKRDKLDDLIRQEQRQVYLEEREEQRVVEEVIDKYVGTIYNNPTADHTALIAQANAEGGYKAAEKLRAIASAARGYSDNYASGSATRNKGIDAIARYNLRIAADQGTLTETMLITAMHDNLIGPDEAWNLRQISKNPSPEQTKLVDTLTNNMCQAAGVDSLDYDTIFQLDDEMTDVHLRYRADFLKENGRQPTFDEVRRYMASYATERTKTLSVEQETKRKAREEKQAFDDELTKQFSNKAVAYTPEQFAVLMDEYKRLGANSRLMKLKAENNLGQNLTENAFIQMIGVASGISAQTLTNQYGIPTIPLGY